MSRKSSISDLKTSNDYVGTTTGISMLCQHSPIDHNRLSFLSLCTFNTHTPTHTQPTLHNFTTHFRTHTRCIYKQANIRLYTQNGRSFACNFAFLFAFMKLNEFIVITVEMIIKKKLNFELI